jgi:hypothetical protein
MAAPTAQQQRVGGFLVFPLISGFHLNVHFETQFAAIRQLRAVRGNLQREKHEPN